MFKQITVLGAGLIGSSIARAVRARGLCERLIIVDQSLEVLATCRGLELANIYTDDPAHGVLGSDLVVLCVPVGAMAAVGQTIAPALKPGVIVTDVGSVKLAIVEALQPYLPESSHLIPAHPIAGTEHSGPEAGFAELFDGRWCLITPPAEADLRVIERVTMFWEALGSRIEVMDADHHDLVLGMTSHVPHLLAYSLMNAAAELESDTGQDVLKYSVNSFHGFTRVASSDPVMWRDVFLTNKKHALETLEYAQRELEGLRKAIKRNDGTFLEDRFAKGRDVRARWLKNRAQ